MKPALKVAALLVAFAGAAGAFGFVYLLAGGLSARAQPGQVETFLARTTRNAIIRQHALASRNPVPANDGTIAEGRAHFADHCASCHGNDGSGQTKMGRGLYPKAPDMRLPATQNLSDGELFRIIEHGIRFTGMPAWGTGTRESEDASWRLVHFIRHLPQVTPEEIAQMETLNPRSPEEMRQQIEEDRFLQGGDAAPPHSTTHEHTGGHQ